MLGVLIGIVVFIFPLVLTPQVETTTVFPRGDPLSAAILISNRNPFTPLTDVEYSCEVWKVTLDSGANLTNANVLVRGRLSKFEGRRAITARCEAGHVAETRIRAAEYRLTITYRAYPWPQYRTTVYRVAAEIGQDGQVIGWDLN